MSEHSAEYYKEKYKLEEHHINLLNLLCKFSDFCERNQISYTLDGGSLLGAIRHKGFIPWDDDADVSMTRKQFTKLKKAVSHQTQIKVHYHLWIPRIYISNEDLNNYVFLDLFVYDVVPKQKILKFLKRNLILFMQGLMHKTYVPDSQRKRSLRIILFLLWLIGKIVPKKVKLVVYSIVSRFRLANSDYVSVYNDTYKRISKDRNEFRSEWFKKHISVEFENKKFKSVENYHEHLEKLFGNYKELPPIAMRKPEHFFTSKKILDNKN